ncbi:MAG: YcaQ family DNA glycosylase [Anaerolineales bacterium]|nr:YcaQ family DNA glycosylase [Anaerolineales bacterium]
MSKSEKVYSLAAARTMALHAQNLTEPVQKAAGKIDQELIYQTVSELGCIQIDTLHVVERSQYLVLWSRLGSYEKSDFDRLLYDPEKRRLFEGWQHAACFIPLEDFCYQLPRMQSVQQKHIEQSEWLAEPENQELIKSVYARINAEGPLRARDFEYDGPKRSGWWDWKPAKNALEYLNAWGDLMITDRVNFQRVYDLRERVLPDWVNDENPGEEQRDRYWLEHGVRRLGICQPLQAADYSYLRRNYMRGYINDMVAEGIFVEVQVEGSEGSNQLFIIHSQARDILEKADSGEILPRRITFLSPFDNLLWARDRDGQFWNFRALLEAYKPAATREWGYFNMPVLYHDQLIGRIDPKMDRKSGTMLIRGFFLEQDVELHEDLIGGLADAFRSFMDFHQAKDLVFERRKDAKLAKKIAAHL